MEQLMACPWIELERDIPRPAWRYCSATDALFAANGSASPELNEYRQPSTDMDHVVRLSRPACALHQVHEQLCTRREPASCCEFSMA